ncbi:lysophospholipid acyltransferase family protein [Consotaella salsifontis]|uniref:DUF374 domain-containing protein n=1 Tax=Consotaella salsifontis TaxID=1365950 RepID=A0A1T4PZM3_9HYPH|nr:lysophospholipid acyltransferase family protein [Consotaella salsifontis]SJZ96418.1 hypothetical protein SAMN05428963_104240 [Consotaella salsifontis]
MHALGGLIYRCLKFVGATQRLVEGSSDWTKAMTEHHPAIVAFWHGQHLMAPLFRPQSLPYVALLSRSRDAEINAVVVERFGISTVRGSGGRVREASLQKGGVRALMSLRRNLKEGQGVCMIADIPKGTAREAGLGIVTLSRISGRPILPAAAVSSHRYVVERSWDKTTIPLPFGRVAVVVGDPIHVSPHADDVEMEEVRRAVTIALEDVSQRAEALLRKAA